MIEGFAQHWLTMHCRVIPGTVQGSVSLRSGRAVLARWPADASANANLIDVADQAIARGKPVARSHAGRDRSRLPHSEIALPFETGTARGAIAVAVQHSAGPASESSCKAIVDLLMPAAETFGQIAREESSRQRMVTVLEIVGSALSQPTDGKGSAAATLLATRLACERVSIGLFRGHQMQIRSLSHSTSFDAKSTLIRDLQRAMEESADQDATVVLPALDARTPQVALAHEQLLDQHGAGAVCSVPLTHSGKIVGALTFERRRGKPMDAATVALCEDVALLLGPILELERRATESGFERLRARLRDGFAKLTGRGHLELKLLTATAVAGLLLLGMAQGEYRVSANATLEGRVQRAIVAGIEGFIAESNARAGDLVEAGDVLGRLDDRDLLLQRRKLEGRWSQLQTEYREARAAHDRSQASILDAQMEQSTAQLNLIDEQLARTQLLAPFDGVVVEGDLSQSLGAPVERGDVLFEVAPLDGYRIILEVDERDIADTRVGQKGQLALSALPNETFGLTVERVTPVSVAEDGRNYFRVEASLDEPSAALRPGMEGVGKIGVEQRRYLWIWTHKLVSWLRLWAWSWLP